MWRHVPLTWRGCERSRGFVVGLFLTWTVGVPGADWPQYRGATGDGIAPEAIATTWATNGAGFVVWTNSTLTNGFSTFTVSQGRAFTLFSRNVGGSLLELCGALDVATGRELWATPIDLASYDGGGGDGTSTSTGGDGPRGTPSIAGGRVFAFSAHMHLVCLNATNGSVLWSNDLVSAYGASEISWQNAASPRLDGDLIFVNLNTATDNNTLAAFRTSNGTRAWSAQNENMTQTTPTVATLAGVRQAIYATTTGLVSLNCTNGAFLWKYTYPFSPISTSMGASPIVYSNIVFCSAAYGRGSAAARITLSGSTWNVTQLYFTNRTGVFSSYRSIWMTPVCYQGYIYTLCGENSTYLTPPLSCIELSTGLLKWTTNNFGMGGLILVNTNLLVLTEDGQLVLVRPNPNAYTEVARYKAFTFTASAPGKCWNNPSYSDGRIYARSTRGAVSVNVALPPQLKLLSPHFLTSTQLQLTVTTTNGAPLDSSRVPGIEVRATNQLGAPALAWPKLANNLILATNGLAYLTNSVSGDQTRLYFILNEPP
jgi:outer membrane protein assembly factor BamB